MDPKFRCPNCDVKIQADEKLGGQEVICPSCKTSVVVPKISFQVGEIIAGFRLEEWIGSGSMGEVYRATQISMDRDVAIKILRTDLVEDDENIDRFVNEVRILARLDHSNIVTAFEAGEHEGHYFLAMTFVSGENLDERLLREKQLPEKEMLEVTLKIAEALRYAWDRFQILHRDIKPSNIMLDGDDDEVRL